MPRDEATRDVAVIVGVYLVLKARAMTRAVAHQVAMEAVYLGMPHEPSQETSSRRMPPVEVGAGYDVAVRMIGQSGVGRSLQFFRSQSQARRCGDEARVMTR